ncbi:MAG TPA: hypothetical protein PLI07_02380, partial [Candidatus Hydrogenedentes bacterium]|nr:hypothetical protein [Candidatus Hydrogenedentota bacterium]
LTPEPIPPPAEPAPVVDEKPAAPVLPEADKPQGQRTLVFPNNRSMGQLFERDWNATGAKPWKPIGRAERTITIPAGKVVKLVVNQSDSKDLSPLVPLGPDALHTLVLIGNDVTDVSMASLAGMTGLRRLDVNSSGVTDAGLKHLANLSNLRELSLAGLKMTDEGFSVINHFPLLESLSVTDCAITNAVLPHVKKLTGLRRLTISGTKVSQEGMTLLKYDMPKCEITP